MAGIVVFVCPQGKVRVMVATGVTSLAEAQAFALDDDERGVDFYQLNSEGLERVVAELWGESSTPHYSYPYLSKLEVFGWIFDAGRRFQKAHPEVEIDPPDVQR
ncbi:MAG: hypothetical protein HY092_03095 [Candidatus Kerfeldbacteria bacterium]|nr:hypothetical protein [Candidatus Kerfeldbacteria bacterium]